MSEERNTAHASDGLNLASLKPKAGSRHRRKRLGIGEGSGNGKTCGKGQKGQRSRSGYSLPAGFEGGQMPIHRRLPKRGFTSMKRVAGENVFQVVSLAAVQKIAEQKGSQAITLVDFMEAGLTGKKSLVKILGGSEVKAKLEVQAHAISASARAAIEGAGGKVELVER